MITPAHTITIAEYHKLEAAAMPEDELLGYVVSCAKAEGWLVCHFRAGRTAHGWATPIQGHKGYPDLTMARGTTDADSRIIFTECKREKGKLEPDQVRWRDVLSLKPGVEVYCWKPLDWLDGTIKRILSGKAVWNEPPASR